MTPTDMFPDSGGGWWQQLWSDVLMLGNRYRVRPCKDWWEGGTQVGGAGCGGGMGRAL